RVVHRRVDGTVVPQGPRGGEDAAARPDDQLVRGPEVLVAAVVDRSHALGYRHVLLANAGDAGEALPLALGFAVDHVVVGRVLLDVEAAKPIARVRQGAAPARRGLITALALGGDRRIAGRVVDASQRRADAWLD